VLAGSYFLIPSFRTFADEAWQVLTSDDRQQIERWISQFGFRGVLILLGAFLVQMFAFVIPSWLLIVVSVLAYGPWAGSLIAVSGIALATTVAYWLGYFLHEHTLEKLLGSKSKKKMEDYLERYGFGLVAIFRLAPFLSDDAISFVAGLARMKFPKLLAATFLGIAPLIIFIAILGDSTDQLKTGFLWASVISLVGFGLYVWWDQRQR
jgi:uncharacterized membrane protein YdjX (TVP38/TMEM64 family)